jgi:hypothetical protein
MKWFRYSPVSVAIAFLALGTVDAAAAADARVTDVELSFFERADGRWVQADGPARRGMVAISCTYELTADPDEPPGQWSLVFVLDDEELKRASASGLRDAGTRRATRTWYGLIAASGSYEVGCVVDPDDELSESDEANNRLVKTLSIPGTARTQARRTVLVGATAGQAAGARGAAPAIDFEFMNVSGIQRANDRRRSDERGSVRSAAVGENLLVSCSYRAHVDSLNREAMALPSWTVQLERDGAVTAEEAGFQEVLHARGVTSARHLVERWTPAEPGRYVFRCLLDPADAVAEADETNNALEISVDIVPAGLEAATAEPAATQTAQQVGSPGLEAPLGLSLYKVQPIKVPCKEIDVGFCPEDQLQLEAVVTRPPPGDPQVAEQTLRWSAQLEGLTGLEWQVFYFKPSNVPDLAPLHVVGKSPVLPWDNASGGDFVIDLGPYFLPKLKLPKKQKKSASRTAQPPETVAIDPAPANGREPTSTSPVSEAGPITINPKVAVIDVAGDKADPTSNVLPDLPAGDLPDELWVRVVGKQGSKAVTASNAVHFVVVDAPEPVRIDGSSYRVPMPADAYIFEILSYHGMTPPMNQAPCFLTTQDAWRKKGAFPPAYTTDSNQASGEKIPAGTQICKPKPTSKPTCSFSNPGACVEAVGDLLAGGVNLLSKAWTDIKDFAVNLAMDASLLSLLCDEAGTTGACEFAVKTALDVGLMALGIPPDIPNFDQLLEEGVEYLAMQAAAQMAIPPEVIQEATKAGGPLAGMALEAAEAELRRQAQQEIETALETQLQKAQYAYASQVDWLKLYQGLPLKPDPRNGVQPPTVRVRITRNPKVEIPKAVLSCGGLKVDVSVRNDFTHPGVVIPKAAQQYLKPDYPYRLYESQSRSRPAVKPGDQVVVPILLEPYLGYQGVPNVQMYWSKQQLWYALMRGGTATITVGGCGGDQLTVAADTLAPDPI